MSQLYSFLYCIWQVKIYLLRHVVAEDLAQCNRCNFYCNYSTMKKMIQHPEIEKTCPMCNEDITLNDIQFLGEAGVSGMKRAPPPKDEKEKAKWLDSKLIIISIRIMLFWCCRLFLPGLMFVLLLCCTRNSPILFYFQDLFGLSLNIS